MPDCDICRRSGWCRPIACRSCRRRRDSGRRGPDRERDRGGVHWSSPRSFPANNRPGNQPCPAAPRPRKRPTSPLRWWLPAPPQSSTTSISPISPVLPRPTPSGAVKSHRKPCKTRDSRRLFAAAFLTSRVNRQVSARLRRASSRGERKKCWKQSKCPENNTRRKTLSLRNHRVERERAELEFRRRRALRHYRWRRQCRIATFAGASPGGPVAARSLIESEIESALIGLRRGRSPRIIAAETGHIRPRLGRARHQHPRSEGGRQHRRNRPRHRSLHVARKHIRRKRDESPRLLVTDDGVSEGR